MPAKLGPFTRKRSGPNPFCFLQPSLPIEPTTPLSTHHHHQRHRRRARGQNLRNPAHLFDGSILSGSQRLAGTVESSAFHMRTYIDTISRHPPAAATMTIEPPDEGCDKGT